MPSSFLTPLQQRSKVFLAISRLVRASNPYAFILDVGLVFFGEECLKINKDFADDP